MGATPHRQDSADLRSPHLTAISSEGRSRFGLTKIGASQNLAILLLRGKFPPVRQRKILRSFGMTKELQVCGPFGSAEISGRGKTKNFAFASDDFRTKLPIPPPVAPLRSPWAGWCLYPLSALVPIAGALRAAGGCSFVGTLALWLNLRHNLLLSADRANSV